MEKPFVILIAEDEFLVADFLAEILEDHGFTVVQASTGNAAAGMLATKKVHLLLTDLNMPGVGGVELALRAREHNPTLPVVFVTGLPSELEGARLRIGVPVATLPKPFIPDELLALVHGLLGRGE